MKSSEIFIPSCLTARGERRPTTLTFAASTPEQQAAWREMLVNAGPKHDEKGFEVRPDEEKKFLEEYAADFVNRKLVGVQIGIGSHTEAEMDEVIAALKSKYAFASGPTEAELERFNRFSIQAQTFDGGRRGTRYEFYPQFDAREIDYYFADYRVWLALKHVSNGMEMSVVYVDSATATDIKEHREAAKVKSSDL